jgi:hypothetical protein
MLVVPKTTREKIVKEKKVRVVRIIAERDW